jgi:hypothetical protein
MNCNCEYFVASMCAPGDGSPLRRRYPPICTIRRTVSTTTWTRGFRPFFVGTKHLSRSGNYLRRKLGSLSAKEGHQHNPPGNDQVDCDGPFEMLGAPMGGIFVRHPDLRSRRLAHNAPAETVTAHTDLGVLPGFYSHRCQQGPLNCPYVLRRILRPHGQPRALSLFFW